MKIRSWINFLLVMACSLAVGFAAAMRWSRNIESSNFSAKSLSSWVPSGDPSDIERLEAEALTFTETVTFTAEAETETETETETVTTTTTATATVMMTATVTEMQTNTEAVTVTHTATQTMTTTVTAAAPTVTATATVTVTAPSSPGSSEAATCSNDIKGAFEGVRDAPGGWKPERPRLPTLLQYMVKLGKFGDTGRDILDNFLLRKAEGQDVVTVLEIGSWLGHSVKRWASVSPKVNVISVDPYKDKDVGVEKLLYRKMNPEKWHSRFNVTKDEWDSTMDLLKGDGTFTAVQDHLWDLKDRVALLQGTSPEALTGLDAELPCVDVVYIDGGKTSDFLDHVGFLVSQCLDFIRRFPNAVISGDDFSWGATNGHITSAEMSVRVVTHLLGWDAKVVGGRTWIMGPKDTLRKYVPEYPSKSWRELGKRGGTGKEEDEEDENPTKVEEDDME